MIMLLCKIQDLSENFRYDLSAELIRIQKNLHPPSVRSPQKCENCINISLVSFDTIHTFMSQKPAVVLPMGPNGAVRNWSHTKIDTHNVEYIWIIDHFSFHNAKGAVLLSPVFTASTTTECKWNLLLSTNTNDEKEEFKNYISLYLNLDVTSSCKNEKIWAKIETSVMAANQRQTSRHELMGPFEYCLPLKNSWGWNKFAKKDSISADIAAANDKLTIFCKVLFSRVNVFTEASNQIKTAVSDQNAWDDFGVYLKNELFTDIVLAVNDREYRAHKLILSARSPVFAAMFQHNMAEVRNNHVKITDIEEPVLEKMLNFIYTGKCVDFDDIAEELFVAADKYDLQNLKKICEDELIQNLSVENASKVWTLGDLHHSDELKTRTVDFIVAKSAEITKTVEWKTICSKNPSLIISMSEALSVSRQSSN